MYVFVLYFTLLHKTYNCTISVCCVLFFLLTVLSYGKVSTMASKMYFSIASKAPVDMDLDPEMWDNKTITSGLKNYFRSAWLTSRMPLLTALSP